MLTVDGNLGYGQVLRTALVLSALTREPMKIINIRKQRGKPGLQAQHLTGVKVLGEFCNAEVKGDKLGSTEIEFVPKEHAFDDKTIDIGTAGSMPLLLQTLMPLLIFSDKTITLNIKGGTAGLGSPTIEFIKYVTFPIISKLGVPLPEVEIIKQGFYPKGQGMVKVTFNPAGKLNSINLIERGDVFNVHGISVISSLPEHVGERQKLGAMTLLNEHGFDSHIQTELEKTASPGTSITLIAHCKNIILGSDNIGKLGVRAEEIGKQCAKELIASIQSKAALDKWMADQILIFLALAHGKSEVTVENVTEHCETNIKVIEQVLDVKFEVDNNLVSIEGIGI